MRSRWDLLLLPKYTVLHPRWWGRLKKEAHQRHYNTIQKINKDYKTNLLEEQRTKHCKCSASDLSNITASAILSILPFPSSKPIGLPPAQSPCPEKGSLHLPSVQLTQRRLELCYQGQRSELQNSLPYKGTDLADSRRCKTWKEAVNLDAWVLFSATSLTDCVTAGQSPKQQFSKASFLGDSSYEQGDVTGLISRAAEPLWRQGELYTLQHLWQSGLKCLNLGTQKLRPPKAQATFKTFWNYLLVTTNFVKWREHEASFIKSSIELFISNAENHQWCAWNDSAWNFSRVNLHF